MNIKYIDNSLNHYNLILRELEDILDYSNVTLELSGKRIGLI